MMENTTILEHRFITGVHHIGYLVKDMDKSIKEFEKIGYTCTTPITYDEGRDITICFMNLFQYCVELVCPQSSESVVYAMLKKKGITPYHICYEVTQLEGVSEYLRELGYLPVGDASPAPAIDNRVVAFYFSKHMGIIEVVCP